MVGIVRDDKWCNVAFDSELFELALENWTITGRVVYFNTISVIECYCARNFINGNEKKKSVFVWHECIFLPISYGVIGSIPGIFLITALWMWMVAFFVLGILIVMQVKRLLNKMEKGEILCMN